MSPLCRKWVCPLCLPFVAADPTPMHSVMASSRTRGSKLNAGHPDSPVNNDCRVLLSFFLVKEFHHLVQR